MGNAELMQRLEALSGHLVEGIKEKQEKTVQQSTSEPRV
jgi:hypothetical protein